ncbi:uncharacterized protein LOC106060483 [Biomphalaria glabrata]|uniref:Uncharacterized protein LOC106060483 n=1 Tax=Biomphalaria glabrata TaxID=6526 RepID=A0A9W2YAR8_BIOGL|nr:uncharacterized protein LOC106060483 [Biomphalaria glabrata]
MRFRIKKVMNECLLVYNGDHMDEKEQEEYIKNNRNIIILKESKNLTRFEEALNDKSSDVLKGKVLSKNYVTMNINQTWTETSIAQKILHSYLGKGTAEDFLLLCIRLNQLDLAVQHGGLWKFNSLESKAKDENKLIRIQIVLFSKNLERFDFIKYLIQHGVKIKDYLERDDILDNTEKDKTHLKEIYLFQTKDEQGEQKKQKLRCDNYDKTNDQSSNTGNDSKERDLYIYAVITENFKLAVLLWRTLSLLEESTITSTTSITDNEFLSQSIGNYNKVTDKFQKRNKEEKTKIPPKESCDKEIETDSTKYNNEETKIPPKESCDKETETDSTKYNNEETKIPPKESCDKETETDSTKYNNEETKIPPKESCDKETETDSTKYNNEETKIPPKESCDKETETDSTKYNNEETKIPPKESCDKETETDSIKYNNEETKIPPKESCDKETETDSTKYNNEETKIPPKESCDKETETDSTKYNNEKTQEHCDIGTQTVIPEPMIAYKKKYRPLVGRISVSPDFPSTNRWVVKGLRVVKRRDMKDILSGFHKKKHSGYIEKVYRSYFSKRKLKDIRKVFNFPK